MAMFVEILEENAGLKVEALLDWTYAQNNLPWNVVLLMGRLWFFM